MANISCVKCKNNICIGKVSVFAALEYDDMLEIARMIEHKSYKKGEFLCNEGDRLSMLFIVNSGKVKLSKFNREGKEQILNIISDGDIFGEYHLFVEFEPYNFSAIALTDVRICTLSKKDMDYLLQKHPNMSYKVLQEVSKKLVGAENLAQNLSTINTDNKVTYVLNELAKKYGIAQNNQVRLELPITREEMANYAGVTRETMSRKLKILENNGRIETIGNKVIIIKDKKLLEYL